MKTLIFPDLHEPQTSIFRAIEDLIASESPDRIVFLGDYFDRFNDGPDDMMRTAGWLGDSLKDLRRVHLIGNHDASYLWPCGATFCPGFSWEKEKAFSFVLGRDSIDRFQFHVVIDGWLLTHAGLSASWVPAGIQPTEIDRWLTSEAEAARAAFTENQTHWFLSVGPKRGGRSSAGGILWCDHRELVPVHGLRQIYGHTPDDCVRWSRKKDGYHVCLDTNQGRGPQHYAVVIGGSLDVRLLQP
jgi:hypothetical protein